MKELEEGLSKSVSIDGLGQFTLKRPSIADLQRIHVRAARYREGMETSGAFSDTLAMMRATLDFVVVEGKEKLDWEKLHDAEPAFRLFNAYLEWMAQFFPGVPAA